jgi:hypothetical protein
MRFGAAAPVGACRKVPAGLPALVTQFARVATPSISRPHQTTGACDGQREARLARASNPRLPGIGLFPRTFYVHSRCHGNHSHDTGRHAAARLKILHNPQRRYGNIPRDSDY